MTKPLISPDIIDTLAATMTAIVGDTAQIFAGARAAEPMLGADSVRDFVGRVLEHFVARLGGARLVASRTPVADAAMAEAMLRGIARWPVERAPRGRGVAVGAEPVPARHRPPGSRHRPAFVAGAGAHRRLGRALFAKESAMRPSGRAPDQMRAITIEPRFTRHAEGSVLIGFGDTKVLVTASVEERLPPWLRGKGEGWVTAEYGMLPRATHTRGNREAAKGKQSGRTQEIQRLIGRSLRAVTDLKLLGERQITLDCDVIQADGGTRTASISGAWVALRLAIDGLMRDGKLTADPLTQKVAAVSCGIHEGTPVLDLDYIEDSNAHADGNFVLLESGNIAEAQVTAEGATYDEEALLRLLRLARIGCAEIFAAQARAVA